MNTDLRLAAAGDREAAARVYDATIAPAWRLALAIHGCPDRATETVTAAYRAAFADPNVPLDLSPATWVLTQVRAATRSHDAAA